MSCEGTDGVTSCGRRKVDVWAVWCHARRRDVKSRAQRPREATCTEKVWRDAEIGCVPMSVRRGTSDSLLEFV